MSIFKMEKWNQELEERIEQVNREEQSYYHMKKRDYVIVGIVCVLCLAGIIVGGFLS